MGKLLFWILLGLIVWFAWRAWKRSLEGEQDGPGAQAKPPVVQRMVTCSYCGLRLPESEALQREDEWFCCEAHRDKPSV